MSVHTISEIFKYPVIVKQERKGIYKVRLHDGKVSDMFKGPFEPESYITFQKSLIEEFISNILTFDDWEITNISYDSMNLCEISIPVLISDYSEVSKRIVTKHYERTKFSPIITFPFTTRASLCSYFDNLIISIMISKEDELGPRKWVIRFNNRSIFLHLRRILKHSPTSGEMLCFKEYKKKDIIEKMDLSCISAKWTLFEPLDDSIIGFNQY